MWKHRILTSWSRENDRSFKTIKKNWESLLTGKMEDEKQEEIKLISTKHLSWRGLETITDVKNGCGYLFMNSSVMTISTHLICRLCTQMNVCSWTSFHDSELSGKKGFYTHLIFLCFEGWCYKCKVLDYFFGVFCFFPAPDSPLRKY